MAMTCLSSSASPPQVTDCMPFVGSCFNHSRSLSRECSLQGKGQEKRGGKGREREMEVEIECGGRGRKDGGGRNT